jgi:hypothetical protein
VEQQQPLVIKTETRTDEETPEEDEAESTGAPHADFGLAPVKCKLAFLVSSVGSVAVVQF